jgi:hypothetical protein
MERLKSQKFRKAVGNVILGHEHDTQREQMARWRSIYCNPGLRSSSKPIFGIIVLLDYGLAYHSLIFPPLTCILPNPISVSFQRDVTSPLYLFTLDGGALPGVLKLRPLSRSSN